LKEDFEMRATYEEPKMELLVFETEDIMSESIEMGDNEVPFM